MNNKIRFYDNPDFNDRYTIILPNSRFVHYYHGLQYEALGMNDLPFSPNMGVCQHSECPAGEHLGKRINYSDLPDDCKKVLRQYDYVGEQIEFNFNA